MHELVDADPPPEARVGRRQAERVGDLILQPVLVVVPDELGRHDADSELRRGRGQHQEHERGQQRVVEGVDQAGRVPVAPLVGGLVARLQQKICDEVLGDQHADSDQYGFRRGHRG